MLEHPPPCGEGWGGRMSKPATFAEWQELAEDVFSESQPQQFQCWPMLGCQTSINCNLLISRLDAL